MFPEVEVIWKRRYVRSESHAMHYDVQPVLLHVHIYRRGKEFNCP